MIETPKWYLLVEYWCRTRRPKGYGLTIPFVIGSIDGMDIKQLLNEISNEKCPECIILRYCWDLEEYVLTFDEWLSSCSNHLKRFDNLLVYDDYGIIDKLNSIDDLTDFFVGRYSKCLSEKKFSLNNGNNEWVHFTEDDNWRFNFDR